MMRSGRGFRAVTLALTACSFAIALSVSVSGRPADDLRIKAPRGEQRLDGAMQQYVLVGEERILTTDDWLADSIIVGPSIEPVPEFFPDDTAFGGGATAVLDLNGDGIDDLAIAVTGFKRPAGLGGVAAEDGPGGTSGAQQVGEDGAGAVFVFFGNELNDPRFRDSAGEVETDGWDRADVVIVGAQCGDKLGAGGLVVGDFNNDGYADLAIGAPGHALFQTPTIKSGAAYVIHGGPGGILSGYIYEADQQPDTTRRFDSAGVIVDTAKTAGDGGIALPFTNGTRRETYNGRPVVAPDVAIFGDPSLASSDFDSTLDFTYGEAMRVLDFNGDGVDDLAIGAGSMGTDEVPGSGGAYVLFGWDSAVPPPVPTAATSSHELGFGGTIVLGDSVPGVRIFGDSSFAGLTSVNQMAVGDFDGDGIADLLLGAPRRDTAYPRAHLFFGSQDYFAGQTILAGEAGNPNGAIFTGRAGDDFAEPISIYAANESMDYNGDGIDDPLFYDPYFTANSPAETAPYSTGVVYVVAGGPSLRDANVELDVALGDDPTDVPTLSDERILVALLGSAEYMSIGDGIIAHGDLNGDGLDDLVVGGVSYLPDTSLRTENSGVAIVRGRPDSNGRVVQVGAIPATYAALEPADTFIRESTDWFGPDNPTGIADTAALVADFNGDGMEDLVLASRRLVNLEVQLIPRQVSYAFADGATYVIYGQGAPMPSLVELESGSDDLAYPEVFAWYGAQGTKLNGGRRMAALDFYQDGIDDLVLFSYRADVNLPGVGVRQNAGVAHVLDGSNDLPPVEEGIVVRTNHAGNPLDRSHRTARARVDFARGGSNSFTNVRVSRSPDLIIGADPIAGVVWEVASNRFDSGNPIPGSNGKMTFKYLNTEIGELDEKQLAVLFGPTPSGPWTAISSLPRKQVDIDLNTITVNFPNPLTPPDKPENDPQTPTLRTSINPVRGIRGMDGDLAMTNNFQRQSPLIGYFVIGDPGNILAVNLVSFTASTEGVGSPVLLEWETGFEVDNAGFYIVRASKINNTWTAGEPVTPFLIGAQGVASNYSFTDIRPMQSGENRAYLLLDVDVSGERTAHGPAIVVAPHVPSSVRDWSLY